MNTPTERLMAVILKVQAEAHLDNFYIAAIEGVDVDTGEVVDLDAFRRAHSTSLPPTWPRWQFIARDETAYMADEIV